MPDGLVHQLRVLGSVASSSITLWRGCIVASTAEQPPLPLVRERLCELEIPYVLRNLGKEHWTEAGPAVRRITPNPYRPRKGGKREAFFERTGGRVQVPYLEDPNTGVKLFESAAIIDYLEKTYAN